MGLREKPRSTSVLELEGGIQYQYLNLKVEHKISARACRGDTASVLIELS